MRPFIKNTYKLDTILNLWFNYIYTLFLTKYFFLRYKYTKDLAKQVHLYNI